MMDWKIKNIAEFVRHMRSFAESIVGTQSGMTINAQVSVSDYGYEVVVEYSWGFSWAERRIYESERADNMDAAVSLFEDKVGRLLEAESVKGDKLAQIAESTVAE